MAWGLSCPAREYDFSGYKRSSIQRRIERRMAVTQINQLEDNCTDFGIQLYGLENPNQGIVHVIGPELGLTQPGMTVTRSPRRTPAPIKTSGAMETPWPSATSGPR